MINTVLIDAGPIIALFDKSDTYHSAILDFIKNGHFKFITTLAVITEISFMLDFNVEVQKDFFKWIEKEGVLIHEISQSDFTRISELIEKYKERPMDFADATLVVASEKTGIKKIISIDSDFNIYRLQGKQKLVNIFERHS